ncbi:MAG: SURF1 family protein [Thiomonas sp.]|nr:SURF1 family protein [Thiomonas sp.]
MSKQITSDSTGQIRGRAFGPRELLIIVLGLLVIGVTASLGFWQLGRAHEKKALHLRMDQREQAAPLRVGTDNIQLGPDIWRRVVASGEFAQNLTIYLQNRQQNEHTGFWVMTPLKLSGSNQYVMVLRGWIPRNFQAMDLIAPYKTPQGLTQIAGLVAPPPSKWFSFFSDPPNAVIRQNVNLKKFAEFHHIKLLPYVLRQSGEANDGLGREWPAANTGISTNYGYAAQWFGMSATGAILLIYFVFWRLRKAKVGRGSKMPPAMRTL